MWSKSDIHLDANSNIVLIINTDFLHYYNCYGSFYYMYVQRFLLLTLRILFQQYILYMYYCTDDSLINENELNIKTIMLYPTGRTSS